METAEDVLFAIKDLDSSVKFIQERIKKLHEAKTLNFAMFKVGYKCLIRTKACLEMAKADLEEFEPKKIHHEGAD